MARGETFALFLCQAVGDSQAVLMVEGGYEIGYHIGGRHTKRRYAAEAVLAFLPPSMDKLSIRVKE